jgi:hypothetical protein
MGRVTMTHLVLHVSDVPNGYFCKGKVYKYYYNNLNK